MIYVNAVFLLAFTAVCVAFVVAMIRKTENKKLRKIDTLELKEFSKTARIILIALILVFTALRIYKFGTIPEGGLQDGIMAAVDGKALALYGTDRFGTKLPAYFWAWDYAQMNVLMSYCMVPFIKLFGMNAVTMRLPILIVSIFGLAAVFFISKKLLSLDAALVTTLLASINPWHFMQSRFALESNMFPHMFILGFVFLIYGINKKPFIYVSMFFFALCMYSYGVAFFMVPFFLLIAAIVLIRFKLVKVRHVICSAALYLLISFPIYITMLINVAGWDTISLPFVTMQYFPHSIRSNDVLLFSKDPGKQLISNIQSTFNVLFLQKQDHRLWNTIDEFGTIYKCSVPFARTGLFICLYKAFKEKDIVKKAVNVLLLVYAGCALLIGVFIKEVNVNRINIIHYLNIIFIAVSIYYIISWKKRITLMVIPVYGVLAVMFVLYYFTVWPARIRLYFCADFMEALEYADTIDFDKCYISPDTQYEGSANVSEILTLYKLDIDIQYFQGKTNEFDNRDIPYKERYIYKNPSEKVPAKDKNVVYIIRTDRADDYDFSGWNTRDFGRYRVFSD